MKWQKATKVDFYRGLYFSAQLNLTGVESMSNALCNTIKHSNANDCALLPDDYHRVRCGNSVGSVWDSLSDEDESAGRANVKASLAAVFTEENKSEFSNSVASYKLCLNTSLQIGKPFKSSYMFLFLFQRKCISKNGRWCATSIYCRELFCYSSSSVFVLRLEKQLLRAIPPPDGMEAGSPFTMGIVL